MFIVIMLKSIKVFCMILKLLQRDQEVEDPCKNIKDS